MQIIPVCVCGSDLISPYCITAIQHTSMIYRERESQNQRMKTKKKETKWQKQRVTEKDRRERLRHEEINLELQN